MLTQRECECVAVILLSSQLVCVWMSEKEGGDQMAILMKACTLPLHFSLALLQHGWACNLATDN